MIISKFIDYIDLYHY